LGVPENRKRRKKKMKMAVMEETRVARYSLVQCTKLGKKYIKRPPDIRKGQINSKYVCIIYQIANICTNIPKCSIPRPLKIYQNFDFGYENLPSGNHARDTRIP
jgi:hypothetical protein